ncbi:MAG: hypothetical protein K9M45_13740, partial [Kiritimatiellales bacterium]|nr:hypothetical protein [Kiritimatiellales bacterium]
GSPMEWTDKAKEELEAILAQIRNSMADPDVDADEVAQDIKARIEAELASDNLGVVTGESVHHAATRIGVQEITVDPPPQNDEINHQFMNGLEKPVRFRKKFATGWFWFAGIILPVLALGVELFGRLCAQSDIVDPMPTAFHALLIALVPLANLLGWYAIHKESLVKLEHLGLLCGAATVIAAWYTLLFLPITPFAIIGFAGIIYFGIGLLCFLPLAPLLSLLTLLRLRVALKRTALPAGTVRMPLFRIGLLVGLIALVLTSLPMFLTKTGLAMAAVDEPVVELNGIRLLRVCGDEDVMNRACYNRGAAPFDPVTWLINRNSTLTTEKARNIYYRVNGVAFNTVPSPTIGFRNRSNTGQEFDFDREQGGDVVAGRLKGLSLTDSRMDGLVDTDAATSYLEWTMVFRNEWRREREARAQIALPPGGVVSRLTLWIDGEEREAAFGGRSQVKQAYKKVVQRRRDPVLVTTSGPDRILMQCYPVPAGGEMKIRIGVTAPLALTSETGRAYRLPRVLERNFRISDKTSHAVWLKGGKQLASKLDALLRMPDGSLTGELSDAELVSPAAVVSDSSEVHTCWAPDGDQAVLQEITLRENTPPDHVALVIDGSASMKPYRDAVAKSLAALPHNIPVTVLLAGDEIEEIHRAQTTSKWIIQDLQRQIRSMTAQGGQDNGDAIRQIWNIPYTGKSTAIIWIHGPQYWALNSGEKLRQMLERQRHTTLIDFQTENGPHRLIEKLKDLSTFEAAPRISTVEEDLKDLFRSLSAAVPTWQAVRTSIDKTSMEPGIRRATDHLVRLYAWDRIKADLSDDRPGNKEALRLALQHHLVTPVSGAVVLETQQQYKEANLKPVDSDMVPNVPEPGILALIIFAGLLLFFARRIIARLRLALEF